MTSEDFYEEALRRVRDAEDTQASFVLNLGGLVRLDRLPQELERLTSLQHLDLSFTQLSDSLNLPQFPNSKIVCESQAWTRWPGAARLGERHSR